MEHDRLETVARHLTAGLQAARIDDPAGQKSETIGDRGAGNCAACGEMRKVRSELPRLPGYATNSVAIRAAAAGENSRQGGGHCRARFIQEPSFEGSGRVGHDPQPAMPRRGPET